MGLAEQSGRSCVDAECHLHCMNEHFGLLYRPSCAFCFDGVALVVGHQTKVLDFIKRLAEFYRHAPCFDQMQTECGNQAAVRSGNLRLDWRSSHEKSSTSGVKHGVIRPVACSIYIAGIQQHPGRCGCFSRLGHQVSRVHNRIPSRSMLDSRRGLEYVSGCFHSSSHIGRGWIRIPVCNSTS